MFDKPLTSICAIALIAFFVCEAFGQEAIAEKASSSLSNYLANGDDTYQWEIMNQGKVGETRYAELRLTSQTWKSLVWKHQLFVLIPSTAKSNQDHGLLFITGGGWNEELETRRPVKSGEDPPSLPGEARLFASMAEQFQTPIAVLMHVPFQPIFDGKYEDQIIAYTFQEFLKTGDPTWPLLLPMVKSAVRGMDSTQEYLKTQHQISIETFTISGASKRGWTTWLTGAVDERATAIAPMVIDVLNMVPQMEHQKFSWGDYSTEIDDYSERGIQEWMTTEKGKKLRQIVDPFSYRSQLSQPKLIMLGTNDAYWPVDALNLYWNQLEGQKHIIYVPNAGHGLDDLGRVFGTMHGFHRAARGLESMPQLKWKFEETGHGMTLMFKSDELPDSVSLWTAKAESRDFREAKWSSKSIKVIDGQTLSVEVGRPKAGYRSFFLEASYDRNGLPMFLSTNLRVLSTEGEAKPKQD